MRVENQIYSKSSSTMCKENTLGQCEDEWYTDLEKQIRFWHKKIIRRKAFQGKYVFHLFCLPCLEDYTFVSSFFLSIYLPERWFHFERTQINYLLQIKMQTFHFTNKFSAFWFSKIFIGHQVICHLTN